MTQNIPKEVLVAGRLLIESPGCWHIGSLARNPDGHQTDWLYRTAVSFSTLGALYRASHKRKISVAMFVDVQQMLLQAVHIVLNTPYDLWRFEKGLDQKTVLEIWDEAIAISDRGFHPIFP
jgi:hypothetical protein